MKSKPSHPPYRILVRNVSAMLILPLLLAACATTAGLPKPTVIDNGCSWARPIYTVCDDTLTDGTSKRVLTHDEAGARICGWKRLPAKKCPAKARPVPH